ncbi:hypothetical protein H5T51_06935 [Candidatus Bathyarchaeota archaeon]|nr:hypothetical protein [Candidatus Bathyarchaeota archaeon]
MEFPERILTNEEIEKVRKLIRAGYKHRIEIEGSQEFKEKVKAALRLIKEAGYYDFLRTYIRKIKEIDGLTQLREYEACIWANKYAVKDPVDAASLFIQKAHHMKEYLEGKIYYGGEAERRSVEQRIEFLKKLKEKCQDDKVKHECEVLLNNWSDSVFL